MESTSTRATAAAILVFACLQISLAANDPAFRETPLRFEARIGDKPVGFLSVEFSRDGDHRIVRQTDHLTLKRWLMTATVEQVLESEWADERLVALSSRTSVDASVGDKLIELSVTRDAGGDLVAESEGRRRDLPAEAAPLVFWDRSFISRNTLFELTQAKVASLTATAAGWETLEADGQQTSCERINVEVSVEKDRAPMVLWFDPAGRLCGLQRESAAGDVRYVRLPPDQPLRLGHYP